MDSDVVSRCGLDCKICLFRELRWITTTRVLATSTVWLAEALLVLTWLTEAVADTPRAIIWVAGGVGRGKISGEENR